MSYSLTWRFVPGGTCAYGDRGRLKKVKSLWWTMTPLTWKQSGQGNLVDDPLTPITGLNFNEALELAKDFEARLPTSVEWEWMAAGQKRRLYPWGNSEWTPQRANIKPSNLKKAIRVGSFPDGATPDGILDVAGNVWEWTSSLIPCDGAIIRGGSYNSQIIYIRTGFLNAAPRELRSKGIGLRLVREE